jgi:hypothetical protein
MLRSLSTLGFFLFLLLRHFFAIFHVVNMVVRVDPVPVTKPRRLRLFVMSPGL